MTQPETPTGVRPEPMRVWLLGGFRVSVGARTIDDGRWRLRKAASLVKLSRVQIAAHAGDIVGAAETRSETEPGMAASDG